MAKAKAVSLYDEPETTQDWVDENVFEANNVQENVSENNGFEIDDDVTIGARQRNLTRPAKYPFDRLEVGQSFHVAATSEMPKPASTLAGAVTNANKNYSYDHESETEVVIRSIFETDSEGKRIRSPDGRFNKIGEHEVVMPVRVPIRHFTIRSVGEDDKRGPGARVFRDL
jgi:hypothetical protein